MLKKKLLLTIIIVSFLFSYFTDQAHIISRKVMKEGLDFYTILIGEKIPIDILYNPGLREGIIDDEINIQAILPHENDFPLILEQFLSSKDNIIVQCSQLDSWHCSQNGNDYLRKIRKQAYRLVIFDGGHHLPTLGMEPDIIIIPQINDYAVHSYMLDGIKTDMIVKMVRDVDAPIIIAQVPRWALVKEDNSINIITKKIISQVSHIRRDDLPFNPISNTRMSRYKSAVFAYIDKNYIDNIGLLQRNLEELVLDDVKVMYLAFDYRWISPEQAQIYADNIHNIRQIKVEVVNEPIKVINSFWGAK